MRTKLAAGAAAAAFMLATATAIAHHSFAAEFDANKPINLKGVVTKIEWANPHTYFYVDVADAGGKVAHAFGLRWKVSDELRAVEESCGMDLAAFNGDPSWTLTMPARYRWERRWLLFSLEVDNEA